MDDAQAAKLRALAERAREAMAKYRTDPSYPTGAAMVDDWINVAPLYNDAPDTILALLDTVDALRRERDEARERLRVTEINLGAALQTSVSIVTDRDAALALLTEAGMYVNPHILDDARAMALWERIDALLGGGEG